MSSTWNQWDDLPFEEEEQLIEKYAQYLVKKGVGTIAQMMLESGGPLTSMFAEFYMGLYGPYFDMLGVEKLVALLRKKRNNKKLIERIGQLEKERDSMQQAQPKDQSKAPNIQP